ncbi:Uncharacterised protein [Yersinia thracica]|uniref:Uncharacterized protein n=1 Tax=Yersinia thracica TaxID=2890319 RepID=A0A0T9NUN1_9GAMM|nr:Uncharacterised protein [Yersinia thracica]
MAYTLPQSIYRSLGLIATSMTLSLIIYNKPDCFASVVLLNISYELVDYLPLFSRITHI